MYEIPLLMLSGEMHLFSSLDTYEFLIQCNLSDLKAENNWMLAEEVLSAWETEVWFLDGKVSIAWEIVRNRDSQALPSPTELESAF